jgi:hypothetical protein
VASTLYETPYHSAMPLLAAIPKAVERAPSKASPSMIPKPERNVKQRAPVASRPVHTATVTMPSRQATSKPSSSSGNPGMSAKHVLSEAGSSQLGQGRIGIAEPWVSDPRLSGKTMRTAKKCPSRIPKHKHKPYAISTVNCDDEACSWPGYEPDGARLLARSLVGTSALAWNR